MCLNNCDLVLERKSVDGEMMIVGTGYKVMSTEDIRNSRMIGNWRKAKP